jgi:hypothetical protein
METSKKIKIRQHLVILHSILSNPMMSKDSKLQHIVMATEQLFDYQLGIQVADIIERSGIINHVDLTVSDILDTLLANRKQVA